MTNVLTTFSTMNATTALPLGERDAHVWYARTAACDTPALRERYRALLSADERERLERFAFDHLKIEYLVTRALCRTVLSAYVDDVSPAQWRFRANAYGRPEIDAGDARPPLRFNLSNARSVVACIVTRTADAGIDVEEIARSNDLDGIAASHFSASERAAFFALPAEQRRERFFELWTLKEAYIKARGVGLSIDLGQFSFALPAQPIGIAFDRHVGDDASHWQFTLLDVGAQHRMAVGIRDARAATHPFDIRVREIVPDPAASLRRADAID
ncbi:4'-phosphopantetheinyl transferase family protein [Burkholderia oklahomensis]|uniref:4'-phosphopantetheinyl transferase superfamily protein n=1 Tax=Burkholderia oklahomensis TaxID=342113 RepID=A0AAI8BAV2_9BURK|nr:4'-phosphopantetheinyl transferase superfamily protein [Burkholderia oklahomensis]AIO68902.1 4'-phosphopantetheinyl transferase superfamily protein [Burkholderia oklahomensis]AOI40361.1 4'-phosphopantetheinyl transferase [Burkholderia oklahomensis EO147]KUY65110.1 4'-phosphopantetheinyl transferase [Burkholderia oklahomensis EO147]MDN7673090.1 4'-phosphopantetheinyl transferase superfamily protein [Burkholderia oklahomensis]QPS41588.1 4'-phosphopantetheinyl transferase superfamily protein [